MVNCKAKWPRQMLVHTEDGSILEIKEGFSCEVTIIFDSRNPRRNVVPVGNSFTGNRLVLEVGKPLTLYQYQEVIFRAEGLVTSILRR